MNVDVWMCLHLEQKKMSDLFERHYHGYLSFGDWRKKGSHIPSIMASISINHNSSIYSLFPNEVVEACVTRIFR
jgi:hypothetical protein